MSEWRMSAYYYDFEPTGVDAVDRILSAVACAGKSFHHTEGWNEDLGYAPEGQEGKTPVEWIQNAANSAQQRIAALEGEVERLKRELESQCELTLVEMASHSKTVRRAERAEAALAARDAELAALRVEDQPAYKRLEAALAEAREALRFYADPQTYGLYGGNSDRVMKDHGNRAQQALTREPEGREHRELPWTRSNQ